MKIILTMTVGLLAYSGLALASIPKQNSVYNIVADGVSIGGNAVTTGGNYDLIFGVAQPCGVETFSAGAYTLFSGYIPQLSISSLLVTLSTPTLSGIDPAYGTVLQRRKVQITGTNFTPGADVRLKRSGRLDIVASNVTVTQPDTIECTFDLSNQLHGLWDVVVKNTDASIQYLPQGFSICLPLILNATGGAATGLDGITRIDVAPDTFGEDVYVVIDTDYSSTEILVANQLEDLNLQTVRIQNNVTKFTVKNVMSREITVPINKEVTVSLPYTDTSNTGTIHKALKFLKERHLKIGELTQNQWSVIPNSVVDPENNIINGKVKQLSAYTLLGLSQLSADLNNAHPYPVPFRANRSQMITFTGLTSNVEIKIYDIAGDLVTTLQEEDMDGEFDWDVTNEDGDKVCSGVYIYVMKDNNGSKKIGKLVIIR